MMRQIATYAKDVLMHFFPPDARANAVWAVQMAPNLTWAKGQVLGRVTATAKYGLYVDANSDGTGVAECIAMEAGKTDASGNVFIGNSTTPTDGMEAMSLPTLQVYYGGVFKKADLVGYDAAAKTDFGAREIAGGTIVIIPS
jgi:hypothetical protein